ncbi:unnamed protein product, partial [marine sediment metagenome]
FQIKKTSFYSFIAIFIYKIILDLVYYFFIARIWAYQSFFLDFNIIKSIESYFLLIIIFLLMPKSKEKLGKIMIWLLIVFSYIPLLTIYSFMNQPRAYMYAVTLFWFLVLFLYKKIPELKIPQLKNSEKLFYIVSLFFIILTFILIILKFGLRFNLDLNIVYYIRAIYKATALPLSYYLFTYVALVINPILFALLLIKRKWVYIIPVIFLQLLLFSVTGQKAFLFVLPFILFLMFIISRKNPIAYVSVALILLMLAG